MAKHSKLGVVFRREYIERVRSKWFIIATFLGPVFFGAIAVLPTVLTMKNRNSADLANVVVLDATGTGLGERVVAGITATAPKPADGDRVYTPELRKVAPAAVAQEEERLVRAVQDKERKGYVVLDSSTIAGTSVRYAGRNASALSEVGMIEGVVRRSLLAQRLEGEGIDPGRIATLTAVKLDLRTEKVTDDGKTKEGGMSSFIFGYVIAFLLYMMIVIYGQNVLRGVMEEKTTRVAEVVVSSAPPDTLLAGKVFGVAAVALTQVVAWGVMTALIWKVRTGIMERFGVSAAAAGGVSFPAVSPLVGVALVLFFVLGFLFYASLFAAIGAMVSNQEDAQQASMPVMLLLVASIIFMQPILLNPATPMAKVASWIPFSAPILMPLRMALISIPWYEIVGTLAGVLVATLGAIWLSARIYRVGLLMYGKKPTIGELARWVRQAG